MDFNAVIIVPTGLGCRIGGHAGDATPAAKLLAKCCDKLILHPNVVNGSDINEMPSNALYVDGYTLDEFLEGKVCLKEVRQNKTLLVVNRPVCNETVNAVSAARATIGADISIVELETELSMVASLRVDGLVKGGVSGWKELCEQVSKYSFDALAIASYIQCEEEIALRYLRTGGINPWGGVEALLSSLVGECIEKPVAHAPIESPIVSLKSFNEVVGPAIAAEVISNCYLHCVLKGLHQAPRPVPVSRCEHASTADVAELARLISVHDVDALVTPYGCWGPPHVYCESHDIPIIVVKNNSVAACCWHFEEESHDVIYAENYLEAAGILTAMQAGVSIESLYRPLKPTTVIGEV